MAKINYIKINGTIRYLETISYQTTLPAATSDSPDLVSVNNKIYVKNRTPTQGVGGVWQFNDRVITDLTVAKNITFTTTSDRTKVYTQMSGGYSDMYYNDTYVYDSADWIDTNYKTIVIIGGADLEDSELESFLRTNASYSGTSVYYSELTATTSGGGIEIIDINGASILASDYQSIATLSTAYLLRNDLFYKLESEDDDYLYFTNNYELAYNRISINKNDWSITQADTINVDRVFGVEITDVPETATNGTLTEIQLATLQASDSNYVMFNNEKYYLNDKGHTEGFLTYSHVGAQSDEIYLKTITITISTRGWVLLEQKAGGLTTDTAYVENSTLYISEGTTAASGGGLNVVEITEIDYNTELVSGALVFAAISEERFNELNNADVLVFNYAEDNYMYIYRDTSYQESGYSYRFNSFTRFIIDIYSDGRVGKMTWKITLYPINPTTQEAIPQIIMTYISEITS